jgi:hypothetical protein
VSFLDNLENNLKALEGREEGGLDQSQRRERDRKNALAIAPWAERLKSSPWTQTLMRESTLAGRQRRIKVDLMWIGTTLRLEARGHRLELRPTPKGVIAVFLHGTEEVKQKAVDLAGNPQSLTSAWMAVLDEQKRIDEELAKAQALEEE